MGECNLHILPLVTLIKEEQGLKDNYVIRVKYEYLHSFETELNDIEIIHISLKKHINMKNCKIL